MPPTWHATPDPAVVPGKVMIRRWWTVFEDLMLTQLIEEAAQSNLDLKAAVARVDEARARLGVVTGERVPRVDAQGSAIRQRSSENALSNFGTRTFYSPGIAASWEIDLFGRIRRSVESAAADFQASEEDCTDVLITLYAEVARTYMDIRAYQARLDAAEGNIKSQKQVLELTRARFKYGLTTDLDVAQAQRVLASSEAEVPPLRIELARAVNTMAVLLGRPPGALYDELSVVKPIPLPPAKATVGVPVDLLRQRPDIRRAERQLAAQTTRIGVATADLYPSFSLTGSFGYESVNTSDLFDAGSRVFTFGPSLRWNIFDGGRIRNQIKVQDALTQQALLSYEQTVLNALNEVENALVAYLEQRIRLGALQRSVDASKRSVKLSTNLYKQGLVDFQNVLDAQRDLFNFENQLAAARGNSAANFIQLYKALGGGWNPDEKSGAKSSIKNAEINPNQGDRS
jgi:NodT family efflux transporter outer membrane factor (OMF) lipoprotein